MMTLTSNKLSLLFCILVFSVSFVAASPLDSSSNDLPEGYSIPEYDSQGEIVFELVAPFIAIAVILQFAFYKVLGFTLATNENNPFSSGKKQRAKARRQSMILSLVVTAMLIPSPYWQWIITSLKGLTFAAVGGLAIATGIVLYIMLSGFNDTGNNGE